MVHLPSPSMIIIHIKKAKSIGTFTSNTSPQAEGRLFAGCVAQIDGRRGGPNLIPTERIPLDHCDSHKAHAWLSDDEKQQSPVPFRAMYSSIEQTKRENRSIFGLAHSSQLSKVKHIFSSFNSHLHQF